MSIMRSAFPFSVAIGLSLFAAYGWAAGPDPGVNVTVTNTPSHPVPVTGSLAVSGGVTVSNPASAPVPVAGVVGIVGTPGVKNVDERGRNPYSVRLHCEDSSFNLCQLSAPSAIPAGKRLVLERVNVAFQLKASGVVDSCDLFLSNPNAHAGSFLPSAAGVNLGSGVFNFVINEAVLVFVEPGQGLLLQVSSTQVGINATAFLSGYLVDLSL